MSFSQILEYFIVGLLVITAIWLALTHAKGTSGIIGSLGSFIGGNLKTASGRA